jgi:hypothetical protein
MTIRDQLQKQMDTAARRFAQTKEETFKREVERLAEQIADLDHLAVLDNALARCRDEDMRTPKVIEALDYFSKRLTAQWPIEQFRSVLEDRNEEGRWQILNASLNGIKLSIKVHHL